MTSGTATVEVASISRQSLGFRFEEIMEVHAVLFYEEISPVLARHPIGLIDAASPDCRGLCGNKGGSGSL